MQQGAKIMLHSLVSMTSVTSLTSDMVNHAIPAFMYGKIHSIQFKSALSMLFCFFEHCTHVYVHIYIYVQKYIQICRCTLIIALQSFSSSPICTVSSTMFLRFYFRCGAHDNTYVGNTYNLHTTIWKDIWAYCNKTGEKIKQYVV